MDIYGKAVGRRRDESLNLLWHRKHKALMRLIGQSGLAQLSHILLGLTKIGGGLTVRIRFPKIHESRVIEASCLKGGTGLAS